MDFLNPTPLHKDRGLVASTVFAESETARNLGLEAYSYPFVSQAFFPVLQTWGETVSVTQPESRLDYALHQMRRQQREPLHLSFMPLHMTYLTAQAPTVAFPFWEYPDLPSRTIGNNLRSNWVHVAHHTSALFTACHFTRQAFERAGVEKPIHVIPVPIRPDYFALPPWDPGQQVTIDCPCYVLADQPPVAQLVPDAWMPDEKRPFRVRTAMRTLYQGSIRPRLPRRLDVCLTLAARAAHKFYKAYKKEMVISHPVTPQLDLSGIVYTTILNPFDKRKNLDDLLTAFLRALGDQEDATLVVKLVLSAAQKVPEFNRILDDVRDLGLRHRCRLIFITDYLTNAQMVQLTQASTYYITATRAEGACLPLQDYLAAGRPGIAPDHTALADYFDKEVGFVVRSHPEPAFSPLDPEERLTTSWNRIVWQSLHNQLQASYLLAKKQQDKYRQMAEAARDRMENFASRERVQVLLTSALNQVAGIAPVARMVSAA